MELLELKSVWNSVIEEASSHEYIDENKVANTIKKDSKNILSKIKRVMYFKFVFGSFTLAASALMFIGTFIIPKKVNFLEDVFTITENKLFLSSIIIFISFMLNA